MLRTLFIVEIAVDEDSKQYVCGVLAVASKKRLIIVMQSLRLIFPRLRKVLLQKDKEIRRFPLPEESRIIQPNEPSGNVLVLPNGH